MLRESVKEILEPASSSSSSLVATTSEPPTQQMGMQQPEMSTEQLVEGFPDSPPPVGPPQPQHEEDMFGRSPSPTPNVQRKYYRGGASEASGATLTDDVAGARDVCMYVAYVRQALRANYSTRIAQMLLSQQFSKFIFTRKVNSGKKDLLLRSGTQTWGLMHCRLLPLPPSQWGSGSSGLQIWLLYC